MNTERLQIEAFLKASVNALVIDVRSPSEYAHAHIPGAISIPLFSDEERKVVGTAYKQESREQAIKIGLDYFGPKMRGIVEEVEGILKPLQTKEVFVYCWRGGMRSAAIAWLLNLYGFKVSVLNSGYKAFRNYVLHTFTLPFQFYILGGYTGSGKTELLEALAQQNQTIVNLEEMACHKGSAFGSINMPPQPSQEMFENLLALQLAAIWQKNANPIWLEDESQRIGNLNIPQSLWENMRTAQLYFLDIPFEERLKHIVEEYGKLDKEKIIFAIERITKRLGGLEAKKAVDLMQQNDISGCFQILLRYYDKHYLKALHNRQNLPILLQKIPCATVTTANAQTLLSKPMIA